MNRRLLSRETLFKKFSHQLLLLKAHGFLNTNFRNEQPYLCPICLREFTIDDLEDNGSMDFLTSEDAPPYALGGNKIALTCKKCNSECGRHIDFHLTEVIKAIDASYFYKGSKLHGVIEHEGQRINVELTSEGDGTLTAYHRTKNNNPSLLEKFIFGLKNKTIGPVLNLQPPRLRYESKRVNYALVKTNYILTFARFGYIFLLDPAYDEIRHQLLNPEADIYPYTPFIKDQFTNEHLGTYYVVDEPIKSILNVFSLKTEYSETVIAGWLPPPRLTTAQLGKNIESLRDADNRVIINTRSYNPNANLFEDLPEIKRVHNWIYQ